MASERVLVAACMDLNRSDVGTYNWDHPINVLEEVMSRFVRIDQLDDGSIAFDTSEGMSKGDATYLLDIGQNEVAFSPPDIWPEGETLATVLNGPSEESSEGE